MHISSTADSITSDKPPSNKPKRSEDKTKPAHQKSVFFGTDDVDAGEQGRASLPDTNHIWAILREGGNRKTKTYQTVGISIITIIKAAYPCHGTELDFIKAALNSTEDEMSELCSNAWRDPRPEMVVCDATKSSNLDRLSRTPVVNRTPVNKNPGVVEKSSPRSPDLSNDQRQRLQTAIDDSFTEWNFDVFAAADATDGPLKYIAYEAFRRTHLFEEFSIDKVRAFNYFHEVERLYHAKERVPYHNNLHAADVTHTVCCFLRMFNFATFFPALDVCAMVFSAAVHDVGHDGRTNLFHVKVRDELAVTYNDNSVLENFHAALSFKLLFRNDGSLNFLDHLPVDQVASFRVQVIGMILATDMAHHFAHLNYFAKLAFKNRDDPETWLENNESMAKLRCMVVHSADLVNQSKAERLATRWSKAIIQEWFLQGDAERRFGVGISPMCDKSKLDVSGSQIGFIDFIVLPTFRHLAEVSPLVTKVVVSGVADMKAIWLKRKHWTVADIGG